MQQITLQITTRNRLEDLKISLEKNQTFLNDGRVHTIICVDGSNDDTFSYIKNNYPTIELIQNPQNIGLIGSRNRMMALTKTPFAVSLDDDAHFLSKQNAESILNYFSSHPECAVMAFRIYWGKNEIHFVPDQERSHRVKTFVGCGHAWRMEHWNRIRPYPEWFVFYGEEEFAGYELFKNNLEVHYVPSIFIQHRVDIKARRNYADFVQRHRRSLRSGWYLLWMFLPIERIPKIGLFSIYSQFRSYVFKGNLRVLRAMILAGIDVIKNFLRLFRQANRLSASEFNIYQSLPPAKVYWHMDSGNLKNKLLE